MRLAPHIAGTVARSRRRCAFSLEPEPNSDMTLQDVVWTIALVGMGIIALLFIYIVAQAGKPAPEAAAKKPGISVRTSVFSLLLLGFLGGSWATLHRFPIPPQHDGIAATQVVEAVGRMWFWQITPATVQAGSPVEFRVTSADVNHGFALYAPDGHIVTQTQAMPGFTNKLVYTFNEPGTYTVQCLEYCGVGHALMRTALKVVAPGGN